MAQPTPTDVHVDAILTNISVAYIQDRSRYVSTRIFPRLPVEKQSDKYYTYTKGDWYRDEAKLRAPATESEGSGWTLSTDSYSCDVYAIHKDLDDQVRSNADNPLNLDREATEFVTQRMLLRQEIDWTSTYFTTGVWDTDKTGGTDFTVWSDYAASDPLDDIEDGKSTMLAATGFMPNTLVLGYDVYRQLRHHPDVVDRVKYTSSNIPAEQYLSTLFGVDRILVCQTIYNSAAEGATVSMGFLHGKHALLCYVPPSPGTLTPAAGYTFVWRGVSDGIGADVGISRFRMPMLRADRVEAQMAWDSKVISSDLGYFFSGAVT
jgi:hypothetical protein